jgi:hypothetical protein
LPRSRSGSTGRTSSSSRLIGEDKQDEDKAEEEERPGEGGDAELKSREDSVDSNGSDILLTEHSGHHEVFDAVVDQLHSERYHEADDYSDDKGNESFSEYVNNPHL